MTIRFGRLAVVLALVAGATVGLAGPASAHNVLTGSNPAAGSTVQQAPTTVTLTFDQPVQNFQPVISVIGPNGNTFQTGSPTVLQNTVSMDVAAGPAGVYSASFRVISADGHPVTGSVAYTVAATGAGTATGQAPAAGTATTTAGDGISRWLWAGIGFAALLVIAAIVVVLRRPRDPD